MGQSKVTQAVIPSMDIGSNSESTHVKKEEAASRKFWCVKIRDLGREKSSTTGQSWKSCTGQLRTTNGNWARMANAAMKHRRPQNQVVEKHLCSLFV